MCFTIIAIEYVFKTDKRYYLNKFLENANITEEEGDIHH